MSLEAVPENGHPVIAAEPDPSRRSFVKRAALAALGASAVAPVVGARAARADGTQPAYTDANNVFTADQQINGRLGINDKNEAPLYVERTDAGVAFRVDAHEMAFVASHDVDWQGQTHDLINLYHKSAGDAIFVAHQGGQPPGFTDPVGAMAAFNVLIPYYLDDTTTGRNGTIVNDRTGTRGLHIESQAVVDGSTAIDVHHFSNEYAIRCYVQPPDRGQPVGRGGGMIIDDWSAASTLRLWKYTAPSGTSEAILNMRGALSATIDAIHVRDGNDLVRFRVRTDGSFSSGPITTTGGAGTPTLRNRLADGDNFESFQILGSGRHNWGAGGNSAPDTTLYRAGANVLQTDGYFKAGRYIVAHNGGANRIIVGHNGNGEAPALSFGSSLDTNLYRAAADTLKTDDDFHVGGALRHLGTTLGFYGATPVSKPTTSGSRQGNAALGSLLNALASIGLISDSTNT